MELKTIRLHLVLWSFTACKTALPAQPVAPLVTEYQKALSEMGATPSNAVLEHIYDLLLVEQNTSIDQEIILRQKLQYADGVTLGLFAQKDSIQRLIENAYEWPVARRQDVGQWKQQIRQNEQQILRRVHQNHAYFRQLSVAFMKELYSVEPGLNCLICYSKIKRKEGSTALARKLYQYALTKERAPIRWQQVLHELTSKEIVIEFVTFPLPDGSDIQYAALILKKDYISPRYVSLCTQSDLDALLQFGEEDEEWHLANLYQSAPGSGTLYEYLWHPLTPFLKDVKRAYYVAAGDLYRLNPAAICADQNTPPLIAKYDFVRLNSSRNLVNPYSPAREVKQSEVIPDCLLPVKVPSGFTARFFGNLALDYYHPFAATQGKTAAVWGNIQYETEAPPMAAVMPPARRKISKSGEWELLTGAKTEMDSVSTLLRRHHYEVTAVEGAQATEERFKSIGRLVPAPRILHIATHGFFLPDTALQGDDPLNRCGLILAGANEAWKNNRPPEGREDGILTAYEIGNMHLETTELVVLSACETGLGFIVNNEGVFGLQRAFKKAGVKNLLVSLWSVPDKATQVLMTRFYYHCLTDNMPLRDALKAAQQWMRQQEQYQNPYYWAGFVLLE